MSQIFVKIFTALRSCALIALLAIACGMVSGAFTKVSISHSHAADYAVDFSDADVDSESEPECSEGSAFGWGVAVSVSSMDARMLAIAPASFLSTPEKVLTSVAQRRLIRPPAALSLA